MDRNLGFSAKVEGEGGILWVMPRAREGDERGDGRRVRICWDGLDGSGKW
jgi:hypothetical protein